MHDYFNQYQIKFPLIQNYIWLNYFFKKWDEWDEKNEKEMMICIKRIKFMQRYRTVVW